jgi:GGDEF domain-containing protein
MVRALAPGVVVDEFYSKPASRDSQFGQASRPGADQVRAGHQPEDRKATMDPLTDMYNRRHFEVLVSREFARAQRHKSSASILMIDIDHFKRINDYFGHEMGD